MMLMLFWKYTLLKICKPYKKQMLLVFIRNFLQTNYINFNIFRHKLYKRNMLKILIKILEVYCKMFFILESGLIISYMYQFAWIGALLWIILMFVQYQKKIDNIDFWMRLIIISLPISYLEITCQSGMHIFKWYNFSILGFLITTFLKTNKKLGRKEIRIFLWMKIKKTVNT